MRKEENLELESQDKVKAFNPSTQEQRQKDLCESQALPRETLFQKQREKQKERSRERKTETDR